MRHFRRLFAVLFLSVLLIATGGGDLKLSSLELAAAPYRYNIVSWELSHLPDKWFNKLKTYLPWASTSNEEQLENAQEFFQLGIEIRTLQRSQASLQKSSSTHEIEAVRASKDLKALTDRLSGIKNGVEETLESHVSSVIREAGLSSRVGLILPPVDIALEDPPRLLIISPRDVIHRQQTILLKHNISTEEMEQLEETILELEGLAAVVEGIGGVATYPSIVNQGSGLLSAAITSTHEWLHAYWFFRPLGWNFWSSPEMMTLNETAAALAGRELGLRVYSSITGEPLEVPQGRLGPGLGLEDPVEEEEFNFRLEMHTTRLRADDLLAQGRIEAAEEYMEARRLVFVEHGFLIRKLNQAYFAFHGTYADSPASVSPIGQEVELLRSITDSVGDFVRTISRFGSYQEFKGFLGSAHDTETSDPLAQITAGH